MVRGETVLLAIPDQLKLFQLKVSLVKFHSIKAFGSRLQTDSSIGERQSRAHSESLNCDMTSAFIQATSTEGEMPRQMSHMLRSWMKRRAPTEAQHHTSKTDVVEVEFNWKIPHFVLYRDEFNSPVFCAKSSDDFRWKLTVDPCGKGSKSMEGVLVSLVDISRRDPRCLTG